MRIADVDTLCLSQLSEPETQWFTYRFRAITADCTLVRLTTDDGAAGIGEACAYGDSLRIRDWVQWLAQALIGRTLEGAWRFVRPNGLTWAHDCAAAGVDRASRRSDAARRGNAGVRRLRLRRGQGPAGYGMGVKRRRAGTVPRPDGDAPSCGRRSRPPDGRRHQRLSRDAALDVARGLDTLGFAWFEEPIPHDDVESFAELNRPVEMPITGGERLTTIEQFRPLPRASSSRRRPAGRQLVRDLRGVRDADLAALHGIGVCPHNWPHSGCLGEMLLPYLKGRGGRAVVLDGYIRDWPRVEQLGLPVWCCGTAPNYTSQGRLYPWAYNVPIACSDVLVLPSDIVIADDDGVVVVPRNLAPIVIERTAEHEPGRSSAGCGSEGGALSTYYP